MLTKDLVRRTIRAGKILPRYLKAKDEPLAARVLEVYQANVGEPHRELADALKLLEADDDPRLVRGLAKICDDLLDTAAPTELNPAAIRAAAFGRAATRQPLDEAGRAEVLAEVATEFQTTAEAVEAALFADLPDAQLVGPLPELDAAGLVARYNLGLAQAVLLHARRLTLRLATPTTKRLRQLFRWLKFHRLLYKAERTPGGWRFDIDGPLAVLDRPSRYGVALAALLPAVLLQERWELEAECKIERAGGGRAELATIELSPDTGLISTLSDTGVWSAPEERALAARLAELAAPWTVSADTDLVELGGDAVIVPDLVLTDPDTGKKALIEVVWRWRRAGVEARWASLRKLGPPNLVLAIAAKSEEQEPLPDLNGPVHRFGKLPNGKALLALCREVAR